MTIKKLLSIFFIVCILLFLNSCLSSALQSHSSNDNELHEEYEAEDNRAETEDNSGEEEDSSSHRVYFMISSDANLVFSRYDIQIELDGESLGVVSNGNMFEQGIYLTGGSHSLTAYKTDDAALNDVYTFDVSSNQVFTAKIRHERDNVEFYDIELSDGIDTIEGTVPNVVNLSLSDALKLLENNGFASVVVYEGTEKVWTNENDYIVIEQSISPETIHKKSDELTLYVQKDNQADNSEKSGIEDKPLSRVYFKLTSDSNLLFSKYDIELKLNGKILGEVSNGQTFEQELSLTDGSYTLQAYKQDDTTLNESYTFQIEGDTVFISKLRHENSNIDFYDVELKGFDFIEGPLPDVTKHSLKDALKLLEDNGFTSVAAYEGTDKVRRNEYEYLVTGQSISPGTVLRKTEELTLSVVKMAQYFNDLLADKKLSEAISAAESEGFAYRCTNESGAKISTPDINQEYWIIKSATPDTSNGFAVVLKVSYLGTPEERAAEQAKAEAERKAEEARIAAQKAAEEAKRAEQEALEKKQAKLRDDLEIVLPFESAKEAVRIAFINAEAEDVFTDDGMDYDPSKFHGSSYTGKFNLEIKEEGKWSADSEWTWRVEDMLLVMPAYDSATKLSCRVTCDGQNYIIYNVTYVRAQTKYINSDDPSKTSGEMTMEPSKYNPYLTVPIGLVKRDGITLEYESENDPEVYDNIVFSDDDYVQYGDSYILKIRIDDITLRCQGEWSHIQSTDEEHLIGYGENIIFSLTPQAKDVYLTYDDLVILFDDEVIDPQNNNINMKILTPTESSGRHSLRFSASFNTAGPHELAFFTCYDIYTIADETISKEYFLFNQLDENNGQAVYVTLTGERWHSSADCAGPNATQTTLIEAEMAEYTPCSKCAY